MTNYLQPFQTVLLLSMSLTPYSIIKCNFLWHSEFFPTPAIWPTPGLWMWACHGEHGCVVFHLPYCTPSALNGSPTAHWSGEQTRTTTQTSMVEQFSFIILYSTLQVSWISLICICVLEWSCVPLSVSRTEPSFKSQAIFFLNFFILSVIHSASTSSTLWWLEALRLHSSSMSLFQKLSLWLTTEFGSEWM